MRHPVHRSISSLAPAGLALLLALAGVVVRAQATGYRVGPRDLIDIKVFEEPALDGQYRVTAEGTVRLPLIGDFAVAGLTESDLADSLRRYLEANYLQTASVTVQVTEFLSQPISIIGAVNEPGNLDLAGRYTLIQAITAAGGLALDHGGKAYVRRRSDNGLTSQLEIDLEALMLANDDRLDIPIFANDVINIPTVVKITVYMLGEVTLQGALDFDSTQRLTVLTAISRAGGVTDRAADKIIVRRQLEDGSVREIEVDYKQVVNGRAPDIELADGDVVLVKESFF